ncbi:hypothetical protein [Fretibacter rubidus]|uniref:hypothetical protein n=1 Tax=Fretibacter rubidus TaxID=570162 RepID=UPI00352BA741
MLNIVLPTAIMFLITVAVASIFVFPATRFRMKNALVSFYWTGLWLFLAMITAVAGGANTLMLARFDAATISTAMLTGMIAAFMVFVMFGWFRLSSKAIMAYFIRLKTKFSKPAA